MLLLLNILSLHSSPKYAQSESRSNWISMAQMSTSEYFWGVKAIERSTERDKSIRR